MALVINLGDRTRGTRAERDLGSRVGIPTRRQETDVEVLLIGRTLDLVQWPVVGGEKRAYRAMSGDARGTIGGINVAGLRPGCISRLS